MKIVHIAPNAPYNDNWGYQDNLLPRYQKKLGHDVTVIITNKMHTPDGIAETVCGEYTLDDGVHVIRLKTVDYHNPVLTNIMSKLPVYGYLESIKPDFIFYHGLKGATVFDAVRYKKRIAPECVIVQDNHEDYNNCNLPSGFKGRLLRGFQRAFNRRSIRYVSRVYGVTPWRREYAIDYYGIPREKTDVLIMGADDEKLGLAERSTEREAVRRECGIPDSDFLVVTGGRIDSEKHIDTLMQACGDMPGIKLLVFGRVEGGIKDRFDSLLSEYSNIIYVGWLAADEVYRHFFAADLVVFPGGHSVMWEQACACKVPCLFRRWEGMEHVNNGGNADFIDDVTTVGLKKKISEYNGTEKYNQMKSVAESDATDIFLYSRIAEKSLECRKMK